MKIGIIGGGQLGMMMAIEAIKLGHSIISLDPQEECSITSYSSLHMVNRYNDLSGINRLLDMSDVLTYEFENVNGDVLSNIEEKLPQKTTALEISQNRLYEKKLAKKLGIPTPKFSSIKSPIDIQTPSIIKHVTGGYDGKGQFIIRNDEEIDQYNINYTISLIMEEFILFDYEVSIISTRDLFGNIVFYPTPRNVHKDGILFTSEVGFDIPDKVIEKAQEYTTLILEELDYVGSLTVEYFVRGEDVVFNEFAPRPHNSGHYTIEGCTTSQFRNHILAITGHPVEIPRLVQPTIMVNVLGQHMDYYDKAEKLKNVYIHDYNKQEARTNRKMGHITILGNTLDECHEKLKTIIGE